MNNKLLLFVFVAIKWNTILTIVIRNHMVHCPEVFKLWHLIEYLAHTVVQSVIIIKHWCNIKLHTLIQVWKLKIWKAVFQWKICLGFVLVEYKQKESHTFLDKINALWIVGYKCGLETRYCKFLKDIKQEKRFVQWILFTVMKWCRRGWATLPNVELLFL